MTPTDAELLRLKVDEQKIEISNLKGKCSQLEAQLQTAHKRLASLTLSHFNEIERCLATCRDGEPPGAVPSPTYATLLMAKSMLMKP